MDPTGMTPKLYYGPHLVGVVQALWRVANMVWSLQNYVDPISLKL